jgi:hypothetical protein
MNVRRAAVVGLGLVLSAVPAGAEPIFLARQYARCTTCHFSPTGGGLLTPYGRSLTREELSTMGRGHSTAPASGPDGEQAFLYGLFGNKLDRSVSASTFGRGSWTSNFRAARRTATSS